MVIRDIIKSEFPFWDEYVKKNSDSLSYQMTGWGQACADAYKHRVFYLQAEDGGCIVGILPLVYIKLPFISGELISMPFCDAGGAVCKSANVHQSLLDKAVALGARLKVKHIDLRAAQACQVLEEMDEAIRIPSNKVTVILKLPDSAEELFAGFKSKLRSQIRKAGKNGLEFKWATVGELDSFFDIYTANMRTLGSPIHSRQWFASLAEHYQDSLKIGVVYNDSVPIGAGIILCHGDTVAIPWASTLREFNGLAPNMLLYWELLKYAANSGFSYFDFGRATPDEGTHKFKKQWGGESIPLHWYRIGIGKAVNFSPPRMASGSGMAVKVWQRLPMPVVNYLGPKIRRYISL